MLVPKPLQQILMWATVFAVVVWPGSGFSCTTFFIDDTDRPVLGTNYDWSFGSGMAVVNKRGVKKKGMTVSDPVQSPAWISEYGSITFNQYGRETPMGGMNEAGLVVHQMMLGQSVFPQPDARSPVKNLQWIQYQLDNFSRVEQVINSNHTIRIQTREVPGLHYLAADESGDCAVLEWLGGKLVVHKGTTLPFKALANNTYEDSMRYLRRHQGFGGTLAVEESSSMSLDRFVKAAKMAQQFSDSSSPVIEYAFDILRRVASETTQWRIVYDIKNRQIHFKTKANSLLRTISMARFDLSCTTPVKIIDLNGNLSGDISDRFGNYTWQSNKQYIRHAFDSTPFTRGTPEVFTRTAPVALIKSGMQEGRKNMMIVTIFQFMA